MRGRLKPAAIFAAGVAGMLVAATPGLAAEKDCSAIAVGSRVLVKTHDDYLGTCVDTDRGNDPYGFGLTHYRRQTLPFRDRRVRLKDGTNGVEEYYCHLPYGIFKQVYRCPCGVAAPMRTRAVCRIEPE